ncbi:hypothetical protein ACFWR9_16575 [Streptomyces sp. NPDC058534]|uniref:hypothetical protein n=1 Tax=Streptomyces sp. NPDC058534 TaxID=3346541 RepID=UPI0036692FCF
MYETNGARSTATRVGLDIFWRSRRPPTLHDPVARKRAEVGAHLLRDEIPALSWYS